MTAAKNPNPEKTAPKSLIVPSSFGKTSKGVAARSPETSATGTRISAAQVHGKGKRKALADSPRWTVEDVVRWLKGEGFTQDVCDKFTGAPTTPPGYDVEYMRQPMKVP